MSKRLVIILSSCCAGIICIALVGLLTLRSYLHTPYVTQDHIIEIRPGSGLQSIARQLANETSLQYPRVFSLWGRLKGYDRVLRTGEFQLKQGMSASDVALQLTSGQVVQYPIAFIEGTTAKQALETLWNSPKISVTLQQSSEAEILTALGAEYESLEGLLFPDTYFYTAGTSDLSVLKRAYTRLQEELQSLWQARAVGLPYESPYEALVLASIIEKETGIDAEREDIAGVFTRRLSRGMRLQSDPTVIYGMGERYDGDIRSADLRETTAYNTYRINGLPPTPIALASRRAIEASLNPRPGDSLYFVATGDGGHVFSVTLEQHNAAVRRFLENSRRQ
ncbi:MAG: endolytic transglycosylase MltG [Pseudohongiellaceae bacterium]|nr:endolytic transglycosylase MltG [Pseudohongiellaceae bacterium]